jgi:proline iminopeptidase
LAQAWPKARLKMVAKAGHALSDTPISMELVKIMDALRA